jgi:hypothetical protein
MQAMGADLDDTIGLLNLFETAGLDSSKATMALNTAVKKLKPGQTIDDLVKQITSIEDPTLRAQKAIEIFGGRGGVGLANALKPGIESLKDFTPTALEAAGATERAASAVESGFGAQFTLLLHKAGGALADFGTQFGPLLMVASAFGPQFMRAMAGSLGTLAGFFGPKLLAMLMGPAIATGAAVGTAQGEAAAAAAIATEATGVIAGQATVAAEAVPAAAAAGTTIGGALGRALALALVSAGILALGTQFGSSGFAQTVKAGNAERFRKVFGDLGEEGGQGLVDGVKYALTGNVDDLLAKATTVGAAIPTGLGAGIEKGAPQVEVAVADMVKTFGSGLGGVKAAARVSAAEAMTGMAGALAAGRRKPLDEFSTLIELMKTSLTPMKLAAKLGGELASKALAKALKDGRPEVRAQAIGVARDHAEALAEIARRGGPAGKKAMQELNRGIRSKIPEVHKASLAAKNTVVTDAQAAAAGTKTAGTTAAQALADGLTTPATKTAITGEVNVIFDWIRRLIAAFHPSVAIGVRPSGNTQGKASGGSVRAGVPVIVGELRPELFVPETNGTVLPRVPDAFRGGGGDTYNITANVTGLVRARSSLEIATQMSRLATFGLLTPKASLR